MQQRPNAPRNNYARDVLGDGKHLNRDKPPKVRPLALPVLEATFDMPSGLLQAAGHQSHKSTSATVWQGNRYKEGRVPHRFVQGSEHLLVPLHQALFEQAPFVVTVKVRESSQPSHARASKCVCALVQHLKCKPPCFFELFLNGWEAVGTQWWRTQLRVVILCHEAKVQAGTYFLQIWLGLPFVDKVKESNQQFTT